MKPQSSSIQSSSRRQVVVGLAGLSLAALLADPAKVARAAASLQTVTTKTPSGRSVSAALAVPDQKPAAAVMLVHEWWGLNDQIKSVASEIAKQGYLGLAVDLYGGKSASTPADAEKLMKGVVPAEASEAMSTWIDWLRQHPDCTGKVASIGWCFGGGMALQAALDRPLDAAVIYYGNVARSPDELKSLKGPVLGQFANQDQWINPAMVDGFEAAMKQAGKVLEVHRYDADHAFANPTGDHYDAADARTAWDRTVAFLKSTLG
ncbi:dienelactone hydrolase family protein [Dongia deserti]|uniref:dienelactone hydrolase family protein n=1 Tax=Dongia deserti TaxID=2268030 RepID=UPI002546F232|nr:dienelactone hydrolase family protein [Dongia deserti]